MLFQKKNCILLQLIFCLDVCFGFDSLTHKLRYTLELFWRNALRAKLISFLCFCVAFYYWNEYEFLLSNFYTVQTASQCEPKQDKPYPHLCVINNWLSHFILITNGRLFTSFHFYLLFIYSFRKCKRLGNEYDCFANVNSNYNLLNSYARQMCKHTTASANSNEN